MISQDEYFTLFLIRNYLNFCQEYPQSTSLQKLNKHKGYLTITFLILASNLRHYSSISLIYYDNNLRQDVAYEQLMLKVQLLMEMSATFKEQAGSVGQAPSKLKLVVVGCYYGLWQIVDTPLRLLDQMLVDEQLSQLNPYFFIDEIYRFLLSQGLLCLVVGDNQNSHLLMESLV